MGPALGPGAPPFTIEQSAGMVGAWAWAERCLFEVVGGWVPSTTGAPPKVYFDACSQHHAWRAELWVDRLPARLVPAYAGAGAPEPSAELVRPGTEAASTAMKALAELQGDAERLAAYCRVVLPRAAVAYRAWQRRCSPSSDRPIARVLGLVLTDLVNDWQEGAGVLVALLDGPGGEAGAAAAGGASAAIERLLLGPGLAPNGG
jgi:hypothetical protein